MRMVALWPKVSREVKKPIAPKRPATPGAATNAGCCRKPSRCTRSIPVRYCRRPTAEASPRPAAAQAASHTGASSRRSRNPCVTTKKPSRERQSVASANGGAPEGATRSERMATATKRRAGRSSGVLSGRGGVSSTPAAAITSAICMPAMEMGRKKACPQRPAQARAAAAFRRSKARPYILQCAAMPLLDRLVLREIAVPLGVGLLAILQLLVILQLLQLNEVVFGSAITLEDLARVTAALAPHFLVVAVPLAFMLGVQLGVGRLAGDQELLALSAAGTSPLRLYRVPVAIGALLSLGGLMLARWAEPWGLQELNKVLNGVIKRNLQEGLEPGIFNDQLPRFMVYVTGEERREGSLYATWRGVLIEDDVGDGAPLLALAEEGRIEDAGGEALALRLSRGELHRFETHGETVSRFASGTFLIGVQSAFGWKNRFADNETQLPEPVLRERIAHSQGRDAARLTVELVRRRAVPFACLAFALLGVPLAVAVRGVRGSAYLVTLGAF